MAKRGDVATTSQSVRTKGRGGTGNFPASAQPEEQGTTARYLRYAMESLDLPPIDIDDPRQIEERTRAYLEHCIANDRKPTLVSWSNWLGVHRDTLNSWRRGEYRGSTHSDYIKKIVSIMEEIAVDMFQNGKINPAAGIFLLKNFYGYKDVQDVVLTPNQPLGGDVDPVDVAQKYAELPED